MSQLPEGATQYLDHGFVKLLDVFGSDQDIEAAARVSYSGGDASRKTSDTRALLRYLMNHEHTSPFEMAEVKFVLRIPIFVMRQLVRHRTANLNEYSGRYSEMTDDCYVPELDRLQEQSADNKQGSGDQLDRQLQEAIQKSISDSQKLAVEDYQFLLRRGLAKELARGVLPVSNYTELYWKCDLNNLFRFLRLRLDPHAQKEIVWLAEIMYQQVKGKFPLSFEAFDDYILGAVKFSRIEMKHIISIVSRLQNILEGQDAKDDLINHIDYDARMTKREKADLKKKLGLDRLGL